MDMTHSQWRLSVLYIVLHCAATVHKLRFMMTKRSACVMLMELMVGCYDSLSAGRRGSREGVKLCFDTVRNNW